MPSSNWDRHNGSILTTDKYSGAQPYRAELSSGTCDIVATGACVTAGELLTTMYFFPGDFKGSVKECWQLQPTMVHTADVSSIKLLQIPGGNIILLCA